METTDKELLTQVRRLFSEHGMKAVKEQVDRIAQEEYEYLKTLFESETKVKKVKEVKEVKEVNEVKEVKKVKSEDEVKEEEVPLENTVVEAPAAEPLDPNQKVLHIQSQKKHVAEAAVHVEKAPVPSYIFKSHGKKKA